MITFNSDLDLINFLKETHSKIPDFKSSTDLELFLEKNVNKLKVFIQDTDSMVSDSPKYVVDVSDQSYSLKSKPKTYQSLVSISFWKDSKLVAVETMEYTFKTLIPYENEYLSAFDQRAWNYNFTKIKEWQDTVVKKYPKASWSTPSHKVLSEPNPKYGDLFSVKEFMEMCKNGSVVASDGTGYHSTAKFKSKQVAKLSKLAEHINEHPEFSHIIWFNK